MIPVACVIPNFGMEPVDGYLPEGGLLLACGGGGGGVGDMATGE